jgi:apolipoprotein N-acyltransferase
MLRATNTGISSVIGPFGEEIVVAEPFKRQVLTASVSPLKGQTLYTRWGDAFIVLLAMLLVAASCFRPVNRGAERL